MDKIIEYKFDHNLKISYERMKGKIHLNDLISYVQAKLNDPEYNNTYSILADIRGVEFQLSKDDKDIFYKLFEDSSNVINKNRKCAFLTNAPSEVVDSVLFKLSQSIFSKINIEIFSTKKAAYNWLNISENNLK